MAKVAQEASSASWTLRHSGSVAQVKHAKHDEVIMFKERMREKINSSVQKTQQKAVVTVLREASTWRFKELSTQAK